jgi:hypothetical protein
MNVYDKATLALREAMKTALDSDIDDRLLSELWRHFLGVQSIAKQMKDTAPQIEYKFSLDGDHINIERSQYYNPDRNVNIWAYDAVAADTVSFSTYGNDVITFS